MDVSFFLLPPPEPSLSMPFTEHPHTCLPLFPSQISVNRPTHSSNDTGFHRVFLCLQMFQDYWIKPTVLWGIWSMYGPSKRISMKLNNICHPSHLGSWKGGSPVFQIQSTLCSDYLPWPDQAVAESCARWCPAQPQRVPGRQNHTATGGQPCTWTSAKSFIVQKVLVRIEWERNIYFIWIWLFLLYLKQLKRRA